MDGPRKDDPLVEPLFAGLEQAAPQNGPKPVRGRFWRTYRLLRLGLGVVIAIALWRFLTD